MHHSPAELQEPVGGDRVQVLNGQLGRYGLPPPLDFHGDCLAHRVVQKGFYGMELGHDL